MQKLMSLSADVIDLLCEYAFPVRELQRVQLETRVDNAAMVATVERLGFVREGVHRRSAWVGGFSCDHVIFGLLSEEWMAAREAERASSAAN